MSFVVETLIGNKWERVGTVDNGEGQPPATEEFDSFLEALMDIRDLLINTRDAVLAGNMAEEYIAENYRVADTESEDVFYVEWTGKDTLGSALPPKTLADSVRDGSRSIH